MIDTVLNLLFRCSHRRLTRPMAPVTKAGKPHSQSYVVCLDCGKQFEYDFDNMRIGNPVDQSHEAGVIPPRPPSRHKKKLAFGLLAALPAAILLRSAWKKGDSEPSRDSELSRGSEPSRDREGAVNPKKD